LNGETCQNNGKITGFVLDENCKCNCTEKYFGDFCKKGINCTTGANG